MFFPELLAMPLGKPAPQNKRKKLAKIITDLSHITQDGKAGMEWHEYETMFHMFSTALAFNDDKICIDGWLVIGSVGGVLILHDMQGHVFSSSKQKYFKTIQNNSKIH